MTRKTSAGAATTRATRERLAEGSPHAVAPMRLSYLIGQLDRVVSRRLSEALAHHGLTLPQYTALSVLRARGRSSNAQIAERSFITPQSANEVVKTMEANGWVARESDPMNRRVVLLSLTEAGKALLDECDDAADHVEHAMLDDLENDTPHTLRMLLHACVRNLRAA
jgi:DNA-binding MarR family transcriptional regulator